MPSTSTVHDVASDPRTFLMFAAFQAGDAAACAGPIPYIQRCMTSVQFPKKYWGLLTPIKAVSAVGLASVLRFPALARLTAFMLTVYFTLAVGSHLRARDFGFNIAAASAFLASYATLAAVGPQQPNRTRR